MKRKSTIFTAAFFLCLLMLLCGCQEKKETSTEASGEPIGCEAPIEYDTLDDFLEAVKSKEKEMFNKDHYYIPKYLPDGYKLSSIEVIPMYLTFIYKFDIENEEETPLVYRWVYTGFGDGNEYAINALKEKGAKRIDYASDSLLDVYAFEDYKTEYSSETKQSGSWGCDYLQEGEYFAAYIPWNIEPEELREVLEMTKVFIE